jgi:hypothetical protein
MSQQDWKRHGSLAPKQKELQLLLSMDALCGWRDVRTTARNNTDDVPGRFSMCTYFLGSQRISSAATGTHAHRLDKFVIYNSWL